MTFQSDRGDGPAIYWQRADGTGTAELLVKPDDGATYEPTAWSPDGRCLLLTIVNGGERSLATYSATEKKVTPVGDVKLVSTAKLSPDGRWVAYASSDNAAGTTRVYVQPFPGDGTKYEVGPAPAYHPVWSRDGNELWFRTSLGRLGRVSVTTKPAFAVSAPTFVTIPFGMIELGSLAEPPWDLAPDGKLLALISGATEPGAASAQIQVALNWFEELKQRVPAR